jgi:hypothetical protein
MTGSVSATNRPVNGSHILIKLRRRRCPPSACSLQLRHIPPFPRNRSATQHVPCETRGSVQVLLCPAVCLLRSNRPLQSGLGHCCLGAARAVRRRVCAAATSTFVRGMRCRVHGRPVAMDSIAVVRKDHFCRGGARPPQGRRFLAQRNRVRPRKRRYRHCDCCGLCNSALRVACGGLPRPRRQILRGTTRHQTEYGRAFPLLHFHLLLWRSCRFIFRTCCRVGKIVGFDGLLVATAGVMESLPPVAHRPEHLWLDCAARCSRFARQSAARCVTTT